MVAGARTLGRLRHVDPFVVVPALLLVTCGLFLIHSATTDSSFPYLLRQLEWFAVSLLVAVPLILIPYYRLLPYAPAAYLGGLLLLVLVLVVAPPINGAQRWISVAGISLQPSEFMKLLSVLLLARLLRHGRKLQRMRDWLVPLGVVIVPLALTLIQPDLGTAMLFIPVAVAILLVSGVPARSLIMLFVLGAVVVILAYNFVLQPYQRERIRNTFGHSHLTAAQVVGGGYQLRQSLTTVGNGGFLGHGHMEGPRTQSGRLPYRHNDFIFAVLGEEHGFLGASAILVLVLVLTGCIFRIAARARDPAGRLLCVGVGTLVCFQALIHAGVNLGLIPTTGMPFPLLSHGGCSLLTCCCAIALVLNVSLHRPTVPIRMRQDDPDGWFPAMSTSRAL